MVLQLHDLLFLLGMTVALAGAWCINWQTGLVACGLTLVTASWIVRGMIARKQRRRK